MLVVKVKSEGKRSLIKDKKIKVTMQEGKKIDEMLFNYPNSC
jgi:hypothetical protein